MDFKWTREELEFLGQHRAEIDSVTTPGELYSWMEKMVNGGGWFRSSSPTSQAVITGFIFLLNKFPEELFFDIWINTNFYQDQDSRITLSLCWGPGNNFFPGSIEMVWSKNPQDQEDKVEEFIIDFIRYPYIKGRSSFDNPSRQGEIRKKFISYLLDSLPFTDYGEIFNRTKDLILEKLKEGVIKIRVVSYQ